MRNARVAAVAFEVPDEDASLDGRGRVEYNLENILETLDRAAARNPDFVCFPELALHRWWSREDEPDGEQPVPGPATDAVGEKARELDSYVVLPLAERDGEKRYNSAVLLGPEGDVVGTFRKLRPTVGEIDGGRDPGDGVRTWDTEFGRVGALICFDLMYPEIGVELARRRADLVFFPSYLQGRRRMAHWARDYGFHLVKANPSVAEIATPTGGHVARNQGNWAGQEPVENLDAGGAARFAFDNVNTDTLTFTRTPRNRRAVEEIQREHPDVVYHDSGYDETFVLESRAEDVTVEEIEEEYGMVTYRDWLDVTGHAGRQTDADSGPAAAAFPRPDLHFDLDADP